MHSFQSHAEPQLQTPPPPVDRERKKKAGRSDLTLNGGIRGSVEVARVSFAGEEELEGGLVGN